LTKQIDIPKQIPPVSLLGFLALGGRFLFFLRIIGEAVRSRSVRSTIDVAKR
jgi:hypothetical protein